MRRIKRLLNVFAAGIVSVSSLFVLAPTVHAAVDTCTWTGIDGLSGGNNNINNPANWLGCDGTGAPENNDNLVFPSIVTNRVVDVNVPLTVGNITFNGDAVTPCAALGYSIGGASTLTVTGLITMSHTGVCDTFNAQEISAPIALTGSTVIVDGSSSSINEYLRLGNSTITGSGSLVARGAGLQVQNIAQSVNIGSENDADVSYRVADCGAATVNNNVQLAGITKFSVGVAFSPCDEFTLNNVTLSLDTQLDADYSEVTINTLGGAYDLTVPDGSATKINVNSTVIEGEYLETTYSANSPGTSLSLSEKALAIVTGTYGATSVNDLAVLKGTGTVGALTVNSGGTLAPGLSPGCLNSGALTLAGTYEVEVQGADACTGYDQVNVAGAVNVTGATLDVATTGFVPTVGQEYIIINNDLAEAVTGTFASLAEGATIVDGGVTYTISYVGGDGNDVTLTVTAVDASAIPGAPNTGFALLTANPLATMLGALLAAAGFGLLARRQLQNK